MATEDWTEDVVVIVSCRVLCRDCLIRRVVQVATKNYTRLVLQNIRPFMHVTERADVSTSSNEIARQRMQLDFLPIRQSPGVHCSQRHTAMESHGLFKGAGSVEHVARQHSTALQSIPTSQQICSALLALAILVLATR